MSRTAPALTDEQRARLARIRLAFKRDIEDHQQGMDLTLAAVLAGREALDRITLETLRDLSATFSDDDVRAFQPDPASSYCDGSELLADVQALRADGLL